jgi:hypothetical protein
VFPYVHFSLSKNYGTARGARISVTTVNADVIPHDFSPRYREHPLSHPLEKTSAFV